MSNIVPPPVNEVRAEIVSIGTELLLGEIVDTNASWIAGRLPALGIPLYRIQQVGDNRARLTTTLREAWERAELLILTGGLGPTEDDVTREALADLLGERMEVVPDLEQHLRAFYTSRGRTMPPSNLKQATVIPSATVMPNPIGTAPGWWIAHEGRYIATMPGVPVEMRRMWQDQVVPRLLRLPRGGAIVSRTLKILGIGESAVEQQLGDLVHGVNPTAATYAKPDGVHVRLAARAAASADAYAAIARVEEQVRAIFGASIYGADNEDLGEATARLLEERHEQLAVAEAGLGGALCHTLGMTALQGGLVLPGPPIAEAEAEATALDLARRARQTFGTRLAVGALIVQAADQRQRAAAAVLRDGYELIQQEDHRTDPRDAPRRAVLLALRLIRETLATQ
ncbi:MAG TPA: CinA family nicotinamide mononucleotide deamidase-related protein [Chloroflexota bacterium]|nr:CinA family nicotinamide mononucleotide deamidase-related protein [Chloroflexota bacterium]